jgi:hypothetical protein
LGGDEAHADGETLMDHVAHGPELSQDHLPPLLGQRVGQRRLRRHHSAECGRVIELTVEVLVRLGQPARSDVDGRSPEAPAEVVVDG